MYKKSKRIVWNKKEDTYNCIINYQNNFIVHENILIAKCEHNPFKRYILSRVLKYFTTMSQRLTQMQSHIFTRTPKRTNIFDFLAFLHKKKTSQSYLRQSCNDTSTLSAKKTFVRQYLCT